MKEGQRIFASNAMNMYPIKTRRIQSYDPFISKAGKRRKPKELLSQTHIPGTINLTEGIPASNLFPVEKFIVSLKCGAHIPLFDSTVREAMGNYYFARYGMKYLVAFFREYQSRIHQVPYTKTEDWDLVISATSTPGSTNVLFQGFDTVLDEGDSVFLENPTSGETLYLLKEMGIHVIGLELDHDGLIPESLEAAIQKLIQNGEKMPKILYVIPTGQNPTGSTLTYERKLKIYNICSEHNILIFEDDPNWNNRFLDASPAVDFSISKSFLHLDLDHRVVRFDSIVNLFTSGVRIGFVTGPTPIMDSFKLQQASTSPPAGLAQAVMVQLLMHFGEKGLDENIMEMRRYFTHRKKEFFSICEKLLRPDNLVEWEVPLAGMFCWFKLKEIEDSQDICKELLKQRILVVPGIAFCVNNETKSPFIRACFITASRPEVEVGIEKFGELLRAEHLKLKSKSMNE